MNSATISTVFVVHAFLKDLGSVKPRAMIEKVNKPCGHDVEQRNRTTQYRFMTSTVVMHHVEVHEQTMIAPEEP